MLFKDEPITKALINSIPQVGKVTWIGLRPDRQLPMEVVDEVEINTKDGLVGDRFSSKTSSKRQVTLIQQEHLSVLESLIGHEVNPAVLRRNIVVKGINLLALHNRKISIGDVVIEGTGFCYPCSKMEEALGPGGYNIMRGHGGITAMVVKPGFIRKNDPVVLIGES